MTMAARVGKWKPNKKNEEILDWLYAKIHALPYDAIVRYAFYRVLQQYSGEKGSYGWFKDLLSKARKSQYKEWRPWTLPDDTREILRNGSGYDTPAEWVRSFLNYQCFLDKHSEQREIVIVAFEAAAMHRQFEYYAKPYYVDLVPFHGDYGIDAKWKFAQYIKNLRSWYPEKFIRILYFGDYDKKGRKIPESAFRDVELWAAEQGVQRSAWSWEWIGLTKEHVARYSLPENFEKPGEYQWESLDDPQAREIITSALDRYVDKEKNKDVERREKSITEKWKEAAEVFLENLDLEGDE
jgi:hypothetical protein